jgi:hypothetical protein
MPSLVWDVMWRDHGAQKGLTDMGRATETTSARMAKLKTVAALGLAAVGVAAVRFGRDSVAAYTDAQASQAKLQFAFERFPKLADTNISALQGLNTELAKKTRFDDDATASGQAVLAQFKLTGTQITQLTPLLQDYAAKTGKDLPAAARDLGKAVLGQGRALKVVGVDFKDTGTAGGNFTQIMSGLRTQVGGFAEKEGKTAAGQVDILKNQFGELQEAAGAKLVPALTAVTGELTSLVMWVGNNTDVILPLAAGITGLVGTIWLADKAGKAWAITQSLTAGLATKAVGGLNLLKIAFTGVALTAEGAGRAMKIAQLSIPGLGAVLFIATTAMQFFASKSKDGTAEANSFASAMESVQGNVTRATAALNDQVRTQAVNNLQSKGAYEQAHLLGLGYGTVTDAALGNKAAIAEVNRVLGPNINLNRATSKSNADLQSAAAGLSKSLGGVATESTAAAHAEQVRRGAMKAGVQPTDQLAAAHKKLKGAEASLVTETQKLLDKLTILKDGALSQDRANSAWQESLDAVSKSVKDNGKSLSVNTEKGRSNREAIRNMITSLNDKIVSDAKATHSTAGLSEKIRDGEAKIRAAARAAGLNKREVDKMVAAMVKVPDKKATKISTPGMDKAQAEIDKLDRQIRGMKDKPVKVRVHFASDGKITIRDSKGHAGPSYTAADGAVLPGFTPGRDVHRFVSATAGILDLSGGESVMRPEFTQAVGPAWVHRVNRVAKSGAAAVRQAIGMADGGVWNTVNVNAGTSGSVPTRQVQAAAAKAAEWAGTGAAAWAAKALAKWARSDADATGGGPIGSGGYASALRFAKSQSGKPYRWAQAGPGGYDCSGFMSAILNVIHGKNPYHRLFSTGQAGGQHLAGMTRNKTSPFRIGVFHGNPGHTAGTLNGVNVESSGGRGAHYGSGARGWNNRMFTMHYGLAGGGVVGDLPFDTLDPRGNNYDPKVSPLARALFPVSHDRGGVIPPGDTLVRNQTGAPERSLTPAQNRNFEHMVRVMDRGGGTVVHNHYTVNAPNYVGDKTDLVRALTQLNRQGRLQAVKSR